jgi:ribonuclease HI
MDQWVHGDSYHDDVIHEENGEVILDQKHDFFLGATKKTNNTGELTAIGEALRYIYAEVPEEVVIRYDSMYASVQGIFNGAKNKELIDNIRDLFDKVKKRVSFELIQGTSSTIVLMNWHLKNVKHNLKFVLVILYNIWY